MKYTWTPFIAYMIFITFYVALQFFTSPDSPALSLLFAWGASAVVGVIGWGLFALYKSKKPRR